jgi:hypothetical protein
MDPTDGAGKATDRPFGPDAATILATEHWSLLGSRSLIWNEAMSRTNVFLTVLSASIIALALLADATGFGPQTTALALVLLPVVLLLGIATYVRLVRINTEEFLLALAMNRLRRATCGWRPGWSRTSPPATTTTSRAWPERTCSAPAATCDPGGISSSPAPPWSRP